MKQLVKSLYIDGECFKYPIATFSKLSFDKIKARVFNGPQIRNFIRDNKLVKTMNNKQKAAWLPFVAVKQNFLENRTAENKKFWSPPCYQRFKLLDAT